jgi:hypothetical protein
MGSLLSAKLIFEEVLALLVRQASAALVLLGFAALTPPAARRLPLS